MKRGLGWVGFGFVLVMLGCGGGGATDLISGAANLNTCDANIRALSTAVTMYASDYDDRLPRTNTWCDATLPYAANTRSLYRCPAITDTTQWGYSFNTAYVGKSRTAIASPDTAPLLFESNSLTWNSTQSISDQLTVSRHDSNNVVGYADGHVGQVFAP